MLLVQTRRFTGEQGVVGGLVRRTPPGPHGVQGRVAQLRLLDGEAQCGGVRRLLADAHDDPAARPGADLVVFY
jgi:hypothetical protein